ncbi:hypothetical protein [Streptomyces sp. NPDC012510]|uniref:hypothetical protein n=1 Tax=Streptomyces sp. NPDC012510 TaxID=3364838 RepID=UPI0036ECF92A
MFTFSQAVEGALPATLVAQAHGQAGALPPLSHALLRTRWRRPGHALTLDRGRVEPAHEALIRCGPRLHRCPTEDREATRTVRRLRRQHFPQWTYRQPVGVEVG